METGEYAWKPGSRISVKAEVAGAELQRIETVRGELTAALVVEESAHEGAPLHSAFEWRDEVAGPRYREVQAGKILRSIVVRVQSPSTNAEPVMVRAFLPVFPTDSDRDADEQRTYCNVARVWANGHLRRQVLEQAITELQAMKRRYAVYQELQPVWRTVEQISDVLAGGPDGADGSVAMLDGADGSVADDELSLARQGDLATQARRG